MNLKNTLIKCWKGVEKSYRAGEICSERHLQSELYRLLKNELKNLSLSIFVEPKIVSNSSLRNIPIKGLIPDILITNKTNLAAVIEIKYVPHGFVSYQKDINTFSKFASLFKKNATLVLKTNSINGDWNYNDKFSISNSLLFVYMTISRSDSYVVTDQPVIWTDFIKNKFQYIHFYGKINKGSDIIFDCFPK